MAGRSLKNILRLLLLVTVVLVATAIVLAQDETRVLTPGTPVAGTLDSANVAQVYTFEGTEGASITVTVSSEAGPGLALLVSDAAGVPLAQGFQLSGATTIEAVTLPRTETYYVTVFSAIGVSLPENSAFTLTLEQEGGEGESTAEATGEAEETEAAATPSLVGVAATSAAATEEATTEATAEATEAAAPTATVAASFAPGEILTATGLTISLTWNSTANLDLEVRDPIGGSLRFATPQVESGGVFDVNVNSVCNDVTASAPTEQASWPAGSLPTGSFELLIYYQPLEDCPTADPAGFTITVTLDGEVLDSIEGSLLPNEVYLSSFVVYNDGTMTAGASGLYTDTTVLPLPTQEFLANPQPIIRDALVEGIITSGRYYQVYSFDGFANDIISVTANATSGSLDTLLLLLDSEGVIIDSNDDFAEGATDSQILNRRLINDGTYYVIATRYGKDVGGTEGGYELLLSGPTGDLPQEVLDLGLPRGSIEISLLWNTNADMRLLVRDPRGDTVFVDTISVPSGGQMAATGNLNCTVSQTSPVSYVYWPEGTIIPGLYEVEVVYQNQCNDNRSVNFTLTVRVDGQTVYTDTANPTPGEWYVTNFNIDVNRNVTADNGGFIGTRDRLNALVIDYLPGMPNAVPIASGQSLAGDISPTNKFDLYTFDGEAGDVVSISMQRSAGNLDTTLFLLDSTGLQLAFNDDVVAGDNTDSLISEFTLPQNGQYIIIATHFGLTYGGTTGTYNLTFSRLNS